MVDEWVVNLGLVLLGAGLGSLVGFFLGLKITRKAQINDAKFRVYEKIYPSIEELIEILQYSIQTQQTEVSNINTKDDVILKIIEFGGSLFYLEEGELIDEILNEYLEDNEDDLNTFDEIYKAMGESWPSYFQDIKAKTQALLINRFSRCSKNITYSQSIIHFAEPSQEVLNALMDVQLNIGNDYLTIGLRDLFKLTGFEELIPSPNIEERGPIYQEKLKILQKAMEEDLKSTLSVNLNFLKINLLNKK